MHNAKDKHEVHITSYLEYCCEKRGRVDIKGGGDANYVHLTVM